MLNNGLQPTGVERFFDVEEVIVSKTDPRGVITYANRVFERVSGYSEDELMGRPHNLIRLRKCLVAFSSCSGIC